MCLWLPELAGLLAARLWHFHLDRRLVVVWLVVLLVCLLVVLRAVDSFPSTVSLRRRSSVAMVCAVVRSLFAAKALLLQLCPLALCPSAVAWARARQAAACLSNLRL